MYLCAYPRVTARACVPLKKKVPKTSNSAVVVISPLIALMTDQVNGLRKSGVKASVITSSASVPKEMIATEKSLGSDTLLFCAPEALFISKWRAAFERPDIF